MKLDEHAQEGASCLGRISTIKIDVKGRINLPSAYLRSLNHPHPHDFRPVVYKIDDQTSIILLFLQKQIKVSPSTLAELDPRAVMFNSITMSQQGRLPLAEELRHTAHFETGMEVATESWGEFLMLFRLDQEETIAAHRHDLRSFPDTILNKPKRPPNARTLKKQITDLTLQLRAALPEGIKITISGVRKLGEQ